MITQNDLYKEIKAMEKVRDAENDPYKKALLTSNLMIIKLLHNLRTNSTTIMNHYGIQKVEPKVDAPVSSTGTAPVKVNTSTSNVKK